MQKNCTARAELFIFLFRIIAFSTLSIFLSRRTRLVKGPVATSFPGLGREDERPWERGWVLSLSWFPSTSDLDGGFMP